MRLATSLVTLALLPFLPISCTSTARSARVATSPKPASQSVATAANRLQPCEVTVPNGSTPPGERPSRNLHGNGSLWTGLYPNGTVVFEPGGAGFVLEDGALAMKFWWWRGVKGRLTIEGRRLDASAPPLRASIPEGYGDIGFQATGIIIPTEGCWEVTGRVGEASLTFVTRVVNYICKWHDASEWDYPNDRPTYRFVVLDVDGLYEQFRERGALSDATPVMGRRG